MEVRDGEADTVWLQLVGSELTVVSVDCDVWCSCGVGFLALDLTDIVPTLELGIHIEDDIVPNVNVFWVWEADEVLVLELTVLLDLGFDVSEGHLAFSLKSHVAGCVFVAHLVLSI